MSEIENDEHKLGLDPKSDPEAGTEITTFDEKELMKYAKEATAEERAVVGNISFRGGLLSFDGEEVPGNALDCIFVASGFENRWYKDAWDPDNIQPPDCFALGMAEEGIPPVLAPHADVANPVSAVCKGCKLLEWGSAAGNSRGKACGETRRVALIPFSEDLTAESILKASVGLAKISVTNVGRWATFVNTVGAKHGRPPWAVAARLSVKPHAKYQIQVGFEYLANIPKELLGALNTKRQLVTPVLMQSYGAREEQEEKEESTKY